MNIQTEVLIIGGGATGVGISRDLSLRGVPSLLIEKGDFLSGASGRNHGLFHSGGRYAVSDPAAARECISENRIHRKIAPHCIEATDGLFISLPEDGLDFRDRFLKACENAEIPTTLLSRDETLALEPELNPDLLGAVKVPDGAIDPFTLVLENARDAEKHGAQFLLHTEITSMILEKGKIKGVRAKDRIQGEEYVIEASYLVNATGAWANQLLRLAGLRIGMALSKGSLLLTNQRLSHRVINRCRPPSDGDIIVPNETVSIVGTTSIRSEEVENFEVTPQEVDLLIRETSSLIPKIRETRFIRAYAGIRPLFQSEEKGDDRAISRGFILIDHGERDEVENLFTITGGKFVTYRLMAEKVSDLVCRKMEITASCSTHLKPLPGAGKHLSLAERLKKMGHLISPEGGEIICDCELIQRNEVEKFLTKGKVKNLQDILHRTRLAKGTCQGGFCIYRLLGLLHDLKMADGDSNKVLKEFLEERWRGIRPILWGTALKEEELIESIYKGIFNLK
ncbi:MAG TPA: anaerobic glycerol-3-phosphate dehydrogenase subunit GlpA [Thermodesulfobacteriota bacterium]|nr:anaerobic glycerol-3-phosphate dehydrogenase subunit GlpA [Thermodesulfobacteriota bacterium]